MHLSYSWSLLGTLVDLVRGTLFHAPGDANQETVRVFPIRIVVKEQEPDPENTRYRRYGMSPVWLLGKKK